MCVADKLKKALKVYSFEFFAIQMNNFAPIPNSIVVKNDTYKNSCNLRIETDINVIQISCYSLQ